MKKRINIYLSIFAVLFVLGFVLLAVHITNGSKKQPETSYFSATLPDFTMQELINESSLVVRAKYVGIGESLRVRSADDLGEMNFTDLSFESVGVLYGEHTGEMLTVRVDGGNVGGYNEVYEDNPKFITGKEYVLFLYRAGDKFMYDTEGEHYFIPGMRMGVFPVLADANEKTVDIKADMRVDKMGVTYRDIADYISTLDKSSFKSNAVAKKNSMEQLLRQHAE